MALLVHPTTGYQLEALAQTAPHAVLITGEDGAGKATLARKLVADLLGLDPTKHPYYLEIAADKQNISIEAIRDLRSFLGRKTTGEGNLRRAVVILDGHLMNTEAQNALLKNLEEPPTDTIIVITASDGTKLLPTIRSRTQLLQTLPVSPEQATKHFSNISEQQVTTAFYMSDGRVGLMNALLSEDAEHPLVSAIAEAKELLKMSKFERLARVDQLSKQKTTLPLLLTGMQRVLNSGLKQAAAKNNASQTKAFYNSSRAVYEAQTALQKNVNGKLLLTNLFLKI